MARTVTENERSEQAMRVVGGTDHDAAQAEALAEKMSALAHGHSIADVLIAISMILASMIEGKPDEKAEEMLRDLIELVSAELHEREAREQ